MSDELKSIYKQAGLADRFWDEATPVDLWRLQKKTDFDKNTMVLQPSRRRTTCHSICSFSACVPWPTPLS
jgi:hypothetical protein